MSFPWTAERVSALKQQWQSGLSAAQIADSFRRERLSITRSAVLGKVHRLRHGGHDMGPVRPQRVRPRLQREKTSRKPRPACDYSTRRTKQQSALHAMLDGLQFTPIPDAAADQLIPVEQRRTLMELRRGECKWPVGDPGTPGFFFCGAPVAHRALSYCRPHAVRAFNRA